MTTSTRDGDTHEDEIHLWREEETWVAKDMKTGVTTQGSSRTVALENLDDAVALREGEAGREPTDEELKEMGIDPENNTTGDQEPPDVLR